VRLARYFVGFAFTGVLLVLSFIDLDTKRLPDGITLPSIPIFFLAAFGMGDVPWLERLIGAAAGYGVIWLIGEVYYYVTGREGMGLGDAKLLGVVGALLGWRALPGVIFAASFVGILVSVPVLLVMRRREGEPSAAPVPEGAPAGDVVTSVRRAEVPFGPFLALSAFGYLLYGREVWDAFTSTLLGG
jgi:leader peptidase (prepilin peptidase)/N-methyltransferase